MVLLALVIAAVVLVRRRRAGETIEMNTEYGAQEEDYEDEDTNVTDNNDMYKTGEYADYED